MAKEEVTYQNFASGELSGNMLGRFELPVFKSGCRRLRNNISETQGAARFRCGFRMVHYARGNRVPYLLDFQFNDEQAYELEFTDKALRFYKDEGIITENDVAITSISKANPGVVSATAHGYSDGDEVFLNDVKGMVEVNGNSYIVDVLTADTFSLKDIDGNAVSTVNFHTHTGGTGRANRIYEIVTPYDERLNLSRLKVTQNADTMYIDHPFYDPRKLTRTGHASWTLSRYSRTSDPFLDKKVISGVTAASPGVVTCTGHGYVTGDIIIIEEIIGMTELNSRPFTVVKIGADSYSLKDYITGVAVDTSAYTAYSSAGFASDQTLLPSTPMFHEGRLYHGGMDGNPTQFIGSRSPVPTTGVPRYDDYTAGSDPDHAVYFSIADGEVNHILWLQSTNRLLMAGTFGTEVKISGETSEKPITPSSVNVRAENRLGVADIVPINKENIVIYVQRGRLTLRSFEFDAINDRFVSKDRNLVADHITESGIFQLAWQTGRPDLVWAVKSDGDLAALTFKSGEDISGWHLHTTGTLEGDKFLSVSSMPRPDNFDQLWVATEREINGHTRRFIEFMTDVPDLPELVDFYTGDDNAEDDTERWTAAMLEAQKDCVHLDCSLRYDGSAIGLNAEATIYPSAVSGNAIVIVSDQNVFVSTDEGREIWKKAIDGVGEGRAVITNVSDAKHATCRVLQEFDNTDTMAPGDWYLTTNSLINLGHLEGRDVKIVTDGGLHPGRTVTDAAVELDFQAGKIDVGLGYTGLLIPTSVEGGGTTGPAQGKNKNVNRVGIRFLNTGAAEYGTDLYRPEEIEFANAPLQIGSAQPLFSGIKDVHLSDDWSIDKTIFVRQKNPLPCTVQFLEVWVETDNVGS